MTTLTMLITLGSYELFSEKMAHDGLLLSKTHNILAFHEINHLKLVSLGWCNQEIS